MLAPATLLQDRRGISSAYPIKWRRRRETNARFSSVEIQGFTVRSFPFWLLSCTTLLYRFQRCRPAGGSPVPLTSRHPPCPPRLPHRRKITDAGRRRPSFASRVERIRLITWKVRGSNPLPARLTRAVISSSKPPFACARRAALRS